MDVPPVYNNNPPVYNNNDQPVFNNNGPEFGSDIPVYGNNKPSYNNNNPSFNNNPSYNNNNFPVYNNDNEFFNEIGPSLRPKREVVFPDDEANDVETNVTEIGEADNSTVIEGRALKQMIQSVTKIDVGVQSQLLVAPGSTSIIYFDVTNLRNEPSYHSFNVQDEKRFLRAMEPRL